MSKKVFFPRPEELKRRSFIDESLFGSQKSRVEVPVPPKYGASSLFSLFDKTQGDIVCPHFWEFKPFVGCPFNCSYCYLNGTLYGKKQPRWKGKEGEISRKLDEFLEWADENGLRLLLNTGEVADSLGIPSFTRRLIKEVLPVLEKHGDHKILLLSKGGTHHVEPLLEAPRAAREYFIVSFSINASPVAARFEKGTAEPEDRIKAAKKLEDAGYTVRIRLDPMIPVPGWRAHYPLLMRYLLKEVGLTPERITIGSLRGLLKTIKFAKDRAWVRFLDKREKTRWGLKINRDTRLEMYHVIISKILEFEYTGAIALCKETVDIWEELSKENLLKHPGEEGIWENVLCNCKL